jgi:hypothetical protein
MRCVRPECPVDAIFDEPDLPEKWASLKKVNADWYAQKK